MQNLNVSAEDVRAAVEGKVSEGSVSIMEQTKNGSEYQSIQLKVEGSNLAPVMRINYEEANDDLEAYASRIAEELEKALNSAPVSYSNVAEIFQDENKLGSTLRLCAISAQSKILSKRGDQEGQAPIVVQVPGADGEIVLTLRAFIGEGEDGIGTVLLSENHAKISSRGLSYLISLAEKNTTSAARFMSMMDMFSEGGLPIEELPNMEDCPMFIVTNEHKTWGAGAAFSSNTLKKIAESLGKDSYYILPSSIHEAIILPDNGDIETEMLKAMVYDVNRSQVIPDERLSDCVFKYSTETGLQNLGSAYPDADLFE